MQIELIGCTGAGKSSLAQRTIAAHRQTGVRLVTSYDYVLNWAGFGWVKHRPMRMLILNLIALCACLFTLRRNLPLFRFTARVISRLPANVSLFEKLKIARIIARNVGINEIVLRGSVEGQVVLADEGMLHIANYLFVHVSVEPDLSDIETFLRLVSLPDVVIYVRQPEAVLVSRTMQRGHKRIPKDSSILVSRFIQHSLAVFEELVECSRLDDRLLIINHSEEILPARDTLDNPRLEFARKIFARNSIPD